MRRERLVGGEEGGAGWGEEGGDGWGEEGGAMG